MVEEKFYKVLKDFPQLSIEISNEYANTQEEKNLTYFIDNIINKLHYIKHNFDSRIFSLKGNIENCWKNHNLVLNKTLSDVSKTVRSITKHSYDCTELN